MAGAGEASSGPSTTPGHLDARPADSAVARASCRIRTSSARSTSRSNGLGSSAIAAAQPSARTALTTAWALLPPCCSFFLWNSTEAETADQQFGACMALEVAVMPGAKMSSVRCTLLVVDACSTCSHACWKRRGELRKLHRLGRPESNLLARKAAAQRPEIARRLAAAEMGGGDALLEHTPAVGKCSMRAREEEAEATAT